MSRPDPAASPVTRDHLADFVIRPAPAVSEPPPPEIEWTLDRTIAELRRRGATIVEAEPGVRVAERRRLPPSLAAAVTAHGPALRAALRLGVLDGSVPRTWSAPGWQDSARLHAAWFGLMFSPAGPVELGAGRRVADFARYRVAVAARLAAGPDAPGAGGLAADLGALFAQHGPGAARLRVLRAPRPLAA